MSDQIGMPVSEAEGAIVGLSNAQTSVSTMLATQDTGYNPAHLPHLSNELKMMILSQLSQKDLLLGVAQTCKGLQEICYFLGYKKVNIQSGSSTLLWGDVNWAAHSGMAHIRHIEMHLTRRTNPFLAAADDIILRGFVESLPVNLLTFRLRSSNHAPQGISAPSLRSLSRTQSRLQVLEFPIFNYGTGESDFDRIMTTCELPELERLALTTCSFRSVLNLWGSSIIRLPKLQELHITISSVCQHSSVFWHGPGLNIGKLSSMSPLITRLTMHGLKLNCRLRQKLPSVRVVQFIECVEIEALFSHKHSCLFPNLTALMIRSVQVISVIPQHLCTISQLKELYLDLPGVYSSFLEHFNNGASSLELLVWGPAVHRIGADRVPLQLYDWIPCCPRIAFLGVALPHPHVLWNSNIPGDMQLNSEALKSIRDAASLEALFCLCHLDAGTYNYDRQNPMHADLEGWFRGECLIFNAALGGDYCITPSLQFFTSTHLVMEPAYSKKVLPWPFLQNQTKKIIAFKPSLFTIKGTEWKTLFLQKYSARNLFFLEDFADAMIQKSVAYQIQDLPR
ncbi:hypothetical protein BU24DRAFT_456615 [Aaosphaeria arxii CBS 175.79]|uniref:F-box domain-containing protein n=1 Tax=Aaosphaeria arxii CBS 175.79 TaxID=1450172 RepID=A0A6A5Y5J6_9PLEO|nr:uncharacterized protein BU24DRAFT_456615 [Aaosphaeria arxii CBS 175.79]KAF2020549.1 hypothetical protein BU24DRAFT_456615 [Aaosphaeria arxii CBS 175.79]